MRLSTLVPFGLIVLCIAAPTASASAEYIDGDAMDVALRLDNELSVVQWDELFRAR